jgi:hypothetical protein
MRRPDRRRPPRRQSARPTHSSPRGGLGQRCARPRPCVGRQPTYRPFEGRGRLGAGQPTRAGSRTIRRLLVRASSRSIAAATSLGGDSVDQRLPTRRTSPPRSSSCKRASALSLLRPASLATIAVEKGPDILPIAARRRSGRCSLRRSSSRGAGGEGGWAWTGAGSGSGAGLRPIGGSSPKRVRQLPHNTTGSRPAGRTIPNRRHPRPERHTPQRRPARSISLKSSFRTLPHHRTSSARSPSRPTQQRTDPLR